MVLGDKKVGAGAGRGAHGFKPGEKVIVKYRVDEEKDGADVHLEEECTGRDNDLDGKVKGSEKPNTGTQTGSLGTGSLGTSEGIDVCTLHTGACTDRRSVLRDLRCGEFPSNGLLVENCTQAQISMMLAFALRSACLDGLSVESWGCVTRPVSSSEDMLRMHLKLPNLGSSEPCAVTSKYDNRQNSSVWRSPQECVGRYAKPQTDSLDQKPRTSSPDRNPRGDVSEGSQPRDNIGPRTKLERDWPGILGRAIPSHPSQCMTVVT